MRARERGSILFPIIELQINMVIVATMVMVALPLVVPSCQERHPEVVCAKAFVRDGKRCPEAGPTHLPAPPRLAGPAIPGATVEAPGTTWPSVICVGLFLLAFGGIAIDTASPQRDSRGCLVASVAFVLVLTAYAAWFARSKTVRIEPGGAAIEVTRHGPFGLFPRSTRLERVRALVDSAKMGMTLAIHEDERGDLRATALYPTKAVK